MIEINTRIQYIPQNVNEFSIPLIRGKVIGTIIGHTEEGDYIVDVKSNTCIVPQNKQIEILSHDMFIRLYYPPEMYDNYPNKRKNNPKKKPTDQLLTF